MILKHYLRHAIYRERACWMICEDGEAFTVKHILAWMGDLSRERIIAKHAARQSLVRIDS